MLVNSLKKEYKELVAKDNLLQTKLGHLKESFISQLYDNAHKNTRKWKYFLIAE